MKSLKLDILVGICGPIAIILLIIIFIIFYNYNQNKKINARVKCISYFGLFSNIMSLISITLTYYTPKLKSTNCYGELLW